MISTKTAFVLGAGAGKPYGFPLGNELKSEIYQNLVAVNSPGRNFLKTDFHKTDVEINRFLNELISTPLTVDEYLQYHPQHLETGRIAIALALIPCERLDRLNSGAASSRWYEYLFRQMGTNHRGFNRAAFEESALNLSVITFNYDRSLEYFLYRNLLVAFGEAFAGNTLKQFHLVHTYGQLGKPIFFDADGRDYDPTPSKDAVAKCIPNILVFHERSEDSDEFHQAQRYIRQSVNLCFLGFGYDPKNLQHLNIDDAFTGRQILGSAMNVKADEHRRIRRLFGDSANPSRPQHSNILTLGNGDEDLLAFLQSRPVFDT